MTLSLPSHTHTHSFYWIHILNLIWRTLFFSDFHFLCFCFCHFHLFRLTWRTRQVLPLSPQFERVSKRIARLVNFQTRSTDPNLNVKCDSALWTHLQVHLWNGFCFFFFFRFASFFPFLFGPAGYPLASTRISCRSGHAFRCFRPTLFNYSFTH